MGHERDRFLRELECDGRLVLALHLHAERWKRYVVLDPAFAHAKLKANVAVAGNAADRWAGASKYSILVDTRA